MLRKLGVIPIFLIKCSSRLVMKKENWRRDLVEHPQGLSMYLSIEYKDLGATFNLGATVTGPLLSLAIPSSWQQYKLIDQVSDFRDEL
jgi:hypothetical protein